MSRLNFEELKGQYPGAVQTAPSGEEYIEFVEPTPSGEGFWGKIWEDNQIIGSNTEEPCSKFEVVVVRGRIQLE